MILIPVPKHPMQGSGYEGAIRTLLSSLVSDKDIDPENATRIQNVVDFYETSYRDHILTIMVPLLWKLRNRIASVAEPRSEVERKDGISFFGDSSFPDKATMAVKEICAEAKAKSTELLTKGMNSQPSGYALFLVNDSLLEGELYPNVRAIFEAISEKATKYHPSRDLSFVRLCQDFHQIVGMIGK